MGNSQANVLSPSHQGKHGRGTFKGQKDRKSLKNTGKLHSAPEIQVKHTTSIDAHDRRSVSEAVFVNKNLHVSVRTAEKSKVYRSPDSPSEAIPRPPTSEPRFGNTSAASEVTRNRRSKSLAPWSSAGALIPTSPRKSASQKLRPIKELTGRITSLKHNKDSQEKPDHIAAMFAQWNSAMVLSARTDSAGPANDVKGVKSVEVRRRDDALSQNRSSKGDRERTADESDSSVSVATKYSTDVRSRSESYQLRADARDRLLSIAENAEAEEYALLLRHGTEDGSSRGVDVRDMSRSFWTYPNVFSAHEAISWMIEHTKISSRAKCVTILERMNKMRLIVAAGASHHVKDKRQFWRFNARRVARTGKELRRKSKVGALNATNSKARFRPLQSLSSVFSNRRTKSGANLNPLEDDGDNDDDYSDDDDWDDDDDDAYYNPEGAEDDWDMCDPDERSRNIFVAEVTKRKYNQGIINYKEMCHMLNLIGVRPPPMSVNDKVEQSTRQKYRDGIITYDECCHLLSVIGVKDLPEPPRPDSAAPTLSSSSKRSPAIDVDNDDRNDFPSEKSDESSDLPALSSLVTGDFIGGVGIGALTPKQKHVDRANAPVAGNSSTLGDIGECSSGSSDDDLDGSDLELTDDWDCGLVGSMSGDNLLKTVSIMSSQQLSSTVASSSTPTAADSSSSSLLNEGAERGVSGWINDLEDEDLCEAAKRFLSVHKSEQCLEMLVHISKAANLDACEFAKFLNAFLSARFDSKDDVIVKKGRSVESWYVVAKGFVTVREATTEVKLHEGNCFGSPALINGRNGGTGLFGLGGGSGGITVVAGGPCVLATMPRDAFLNFLKENEGLSAFFNSHVEQVIAMRQERRKYQKARRASMNLARKREVKGISETAKTTRKAKLTRTLSGHRMVNKYKILKRLGRGSYGDVRQCQDTTSGRVFAVKIVNRSQLRSGGGRSDADSSQFDQLQLEVKILREMRHPNVVLLQEVIDDMALGKLYIIQEFVDKGPVMPETLFAKPLEPVRAWRLFRDMMRGLEYLHKHLIIHRDLKPSNILIDKDDNAKIADFGMATSLQKGNDLADAETAGSPAFMAPEVCGVMGNEPYSGQVADIWSLGATMYAMLFGHPPFIEPNVTLLEQFEGKLKALKFPVKPEKLPLAEWPHCQDLLRQMLEKGWRRRLRLSQCKEHEYTTRQGTEKLYQLEYTYAK